MSHALRFVPHSISVLLGFASPAHAQRVLFDVHGAVAGGGAANGVVIGDWDGDGVQDFAVGAPRDGTAAFGAGAVRIHSGANGSVLATFLGANYGDHFGEQVARIPDVNGNATDELLVSAPAADYGGDDSGSVYCFDGTNGTQLWRADGTTTLVRFGTQIGGMGDVDGDGIGDLYAGVVQDDYTHILSGVNGADVSPPSGGPSGRAVAVLDDLDGDGIRELLVGDRFIDNAFVVSPPLGMWLRDHYGTFAGQHFGEDVASLGDLDGDGVREYAIASRLDDQGLAAMVEVYSGATGVELAKIVSPDRTTLLTPQVADAGDVNGDGVHDLAISGTWSDAQGAPHAATFLFSGKTYVLLDRIETADDAVVLAPAGDFDGDGRDDVLVGSLDASYDGRVRVFGGAPLWQNATPSQPVAGVTLDLATHEGAPGKPTVLVVEAVDGAPTFVVLAGLATFGPLGGRRISATVPAGLAGHVATLRAYAHDASNRLIRSDPQDVEFH
jgi:hypothetical protein